MVPSRARWLTATSFGQAVGAVLAGAWWKSFAGVADPAREEYVLAGALGAFGLGAAFWPAPLVAVLLHRDTRAANPMTVLSTGDGAGPTPWQLACCSERRQRWSAE